jgi:hypothetical protein
MSYANFCGVCMERFVEQGWAVKAPEFGPRGLRLNNYRAYRLTEQGAVALPGLRQVGNCRADGMPIFRRWVEAGIAREDACPYCLGKDQEMPKCPM